MANFKYLDDNGLLYFWNKIKTYVTTSISNKQDKVEGKGLSTNDYTNEDKTAVTSIGSKGDNLTYVENVLTLKSGETNLSQVTIHSDPGTLDYSDLINKPTINGVTLAGNKTTTDLLIRYTDLTDKPSIPAATSDLTNDSDYQTGTQVDTKISSAISAVLTYKGSKATYADLPTTGNKVGDVWNVQTDGANYAWDGTSWDKLGGEIDLSLYVLKTDLAAISNAEIDTIISA